MYIIAGLGNPGKEYAGTRHNAGFAVIDALADKYNIDVDTAKHKGLIGKGIIDGQKVILVKPLTYMNLSGECIREVMDYYKADIDDLIVIFDYISLEPGRLRLRAKGSAGGHNGIKNIIAHLNSNDFDRLKIGIGRGKNDTKDYVLTPFSGSDKKAIDEAVETAVGAVKTWLDEGIAPAMNRYNVKAK